MLEVAVVELTAASARVIWRPTVFEDVARVPTLALFADPPAWAPPALFSLLGAQAAGFPGGHSPLRVRNSHSRTAASRHKRAQGRFEL